MGVERDVLPLRAEFKLHLRALEIVRFKSKKRFGTGLTDKWWSECRTCKRSQERILVLDFGLLEGEVEAFDLLGCYAAKVGSLLPTFRSQLLSRNAGNKLPSDAVCNIPEDVSPQQTFTFN